MRIEHWNGKNLSLSLIRTIIINTHISQFLCVDILLIFKFLSSLYAMKQDSYQPFTQCREYRQFVRTIRFMILAMQFCNKTVYQFYIISNL